MKHSVIVEYKRCRGCTNCMKSCPTEAIRVRRGKATILADRCIDCGTCMQACPHHAVRAVPDRFEALHKYDYRVALPDPALYGQFQNMDDVNIVLNGLLQVGFDAVYEVARAAEYLTDGVRGQELTDQGAALPRISSACPTVIRLICMRFPKLIDNIQSTIAPMELAAILARKEAVEKTGLPPERIGVFGIVPCPSRVTAAHTPVALQQPVLNGAFAVRDVYRQLLTPMKELRKVLPLSSAGRTGVSWSFCGGEAEGRQDPNYLAVDGIENVIRILEEIEDGRLPEADFIELNACVEGCVGGCLTVENPFAAHMRLKKLTRDMPDCGNRFADLDVPAETLKADKELEYVPVLLLDTDRAAAMQKMMRIETLEEQLPGLCCGSCGAPSCRAFAEDVVLGRASEGDCIFKVRERMQYMTGGSNADDYLPAPFRQQRLRPNEKVLEVHSLR